MVIDINVDFEPFVFFVFDLYVAVIDRFNRWQHSKFELAYHHRQIFKQLTQTDSGNDDCKYDYVTCNFVVVLFFFTYYFYPSIFEVYFCFYFAVLLVV